MDNINLCSIFIEEMRKLEFRPESVARIQNDPRFIKALPENPDAQRIMLTILLNHIFVMGPFVVPAEIRLALNIASDARGWSDDLKIVLLPFLQANEDHFFPNA